ncbi:E3 SUMO-protein ligase ZBED1-like [Diorhabda sublineata]|uniref:E3 SUMO-protein ligase ZBED1-like n=1 Tax=Diorhabda sublineata TaxID=1163346 RepID=UPI0024E0BD15|nr:E3 SUMO-protein ligase ZBED1-like [Diorhabda sublineata]
MDESHTSENIAKTIKEICDKWDLFDKVTCIVTDNAANMTKACDLLKKRHLPCFPHTMNLAVQENFKNTEIQPILKKCKEIVTFFKSSNLATTKFKEEQRILWRGTVNENKTPYKLIQEVTTRWNSCFQMIKRILSTSNALNSTLLKLKNAPTPLTADDIEILKDLEKCLSVFDDATEKISGSKYVLVSLIIPISFGIYNFLNTANISTDLGKLFCQGLIESTRNRLFPYESRTITRISTILDPRWKKDGFRSAENANRPPVSWIKK